jgi:hypothetical protein
LVQRAIKLTWQLPHIAANSKLHFPALIPRPKTTGGDPRRGAPPPPRGQPPPSPPLAKSSLPLGLPAPARAKPPPCGPRTRPPAANRRRAHRRPGFIPCGRPVRPRRRPAALFPPPLSLTCGPRGDAVAPARPRRLPARGPQLGQCPRARVPRAWLGRTPPGPPEKEFFFFFFSSTFSHLNSISSIFYAPKII